MKTAQKYRRKKVLCTQCQSEAKIEYQRAGKEIRVVTTCPECGKVETESLTVESAGHWMKIYAADRERFCMSRKKAENTTVTGVSSENFQREQCRTGVAQKRQKPV